MSARVLPSPTPPHSSFRRGAPRNEAWSPRAGDIIVSNWASWIEILWLAFRYVPLHIIFRPPTQTNAPRSSFNPVFVLPVCSTLDISLPSSAPSTPLSRTPGRRTGTGSAAISAPAARAPTARVPLAGFRRVGLLGMLAAAGHLPLVARAASSPAEALEDVRGAADRPVVVFPEGTTSNGRALLRFADVFAGVKVPVTTHRVFVMCVRCVARPFRADPCECAVLLTLTGRAGMTSRRRLRPLSPTPSRGASSTPCGTRLPSRPRSRH